MSVLGKYLYLRETAQLITKYYKYQTRIYYVGVFLTFYLFLFHIRMDE